ncbi:MAG: hypothetical protein CMC35_02210 [Flavobacteriaceae bacterium]|nr:hypothetical protein [Flavobacteriaceae bacterium]|tara:strand:- start:17437 stop:17865 length:429 start_codon:yes stop_codon:yes gene_type:complete
MTTSKPNTTFWIIAVVALLWNLMGVFQYLVSTVMKDMVSEAYGETELELLNALPSWYNIVFAVAVFAGLLGTILLLLRRKAAKPLFLLSMLAVLFQMGYWLFATEAMEMLGVQAAIMPMVVIAIAIFLYFYSKGAVQKGWLR